MRGLRVVAPGGDALLLQVLGQCVGVGGPDRVQVPDVARAGDGRGDPYVARPTQGIAVVTRCRAALSRRRCASGFLSLAWNFPTQGGFGRMRSTNKARLLRSKLSKKIVRSWKRFSEALLRPIARRFLEAKRCEFTLFMTLTRR